MSDDEDDPIDSDSNLFDGGLDGPDTMGFGPLIPTESERSLMERVRQELKHELKQVRHIVNHNFLKRKKKLFQVQITDSFAILS